MANATMSPGSLRQPLFEGMTAMAPIVVGLTPFALTVGAAAGAEGDWVPRWLATFVFYGGTTQLTVLRLIDSGAGLGVVVLAGVLTQTRLLAYSSSMAPHWASEPQSFKAWAGAVLVEPTWSLGLARFASASPDDARARAAARRYYAGATAMLTVGWGAFVTIGMLTGQALGAGLLALAVPLSLVSSVVPQVVDRPALRVVAASAVAMLLARDLPAGTSVVAAMVVGVVAGTVGPPGRSVSANAAAAPCDGIDEEVR